MTEPDVQAAGRAAHESAEELDSGTDGGAPTHSSGPTPGCANCGSPLLGAYCHGCGQPADVRPPPVRELLHEAAEVLFDLDNRFFRSVRTLILRPGALSVAWAEGRRAAFTGPVRLYLLFSVAYFLIASLLEPSTFGFITLDAGEEEMTRRFAEALPRMMFVIVPLSAGVFRQAFRATGRLYVEHLAFALHVHAGWYLLFTAEAAVAPLAAEGMGGGLLSGAMTVLQLLLRLATLAYVYLAARRFYGLSARSTALRVVGAMLGYSMLLAVAVGAYVGTVQALAD